jgi:hypothetical protein
MKEINIVYGAHHVASSVVYEDSNGRVFISHHRKIGMLNILQGGSCKFPGDSYFMVEPVVVHTGDYDPNFLSKFNKIFGCFGKFAENTSIKDKFVKVNYGTELIHRDADSLRKNWLPWDQRKDGVIIVASGHKHSAHHASIYDLRLMLADFFYENNFEVSWYGYNGIGKPYYKGWLSDIGDTEKVYDPRHKINEICKYKFNICTENTYDPIYSHDYMTEKLPHAIYGGAVPLYMGCYNIEELAPTNIFFDLRNFVVKNNGSLQLLKQPLLEAIRNISAEDFEKYNEAQYQYIKDPNGLFSYTDLGEVYKEMLRNL